MPLFETALQAHIPFIGVRYADPVNFIVVLQHIAGKPSLPLPKNPKYTVGDNYIYWTEDLKDVTTEAYRKLCHSNASCVVLNQGPSTLVFDSGIMQTPAKFFVDYLTNFVEADKIGPLVQSIAGLSLKDAQHVVQLTMARSNKITPTEIRRTQLLIGGHTPGLEVMNTEVGFYSMPVVVEDWIKLNDKYFLDPKIPEKLVPRGLMAVGAPGTGKSMMAQVLANHWQVPLFRLDIGSSLTRWLGESESSVARNLALLDSNAPCVVLVDEVEKLFIHHGNEETASRILSQLLWWLQNHRSKVLTIMTSNDIVNVPKELYRPGRIDRVIEIQRLLLSEAKVFAIGAYTSILGSYPTTYKTQIMRSVLEGTNKTSFSHAEVIELIVDLIKEKGWKSDE